MRRTQVVASLGAALVLAVASWPWPGLEPTTAGREQSAWEEDLTYGNAAERIAAARAVGSLARRGAVAEALGRESVVDALASRDAALRRAVLRSLADAPEALAPLVAAIDTLAPDARREASRDLAELVAERIAAPEAAPSAGEGVACGDPHVDASADTSATAVRAVRAARCKWTLRLLERGDLGVREFWRIAHLLTEHGIGFTVPSPPSNHGTLLVDPDPRVRQAAAVEILRMGPEALPSTEQVVGREKPDFRKRALAELRTARDAVPGFDLDLALAPLDGRGLERLFAGAVEAGAGTAPLVERALANERVEVRRWAAWSARALAPNLAGASWLEPFTHDADEGVRRFALVAATRAAGEPERSALLAAGLADSAGAVRYAAAEEALRSGEAGCAVLANALARRDGRALDVVARVSAGAAGHTGNGSAASALCPTLILTLVEALPRAPAATRGALEAALATGEALDAIAPALTDARLEMRLGALGVLSRIELSTAAERQRLRAMLVQLLSDPNAVIRRDALSALLRLGADAVATATDALRAIARDERDPRVRARAERALAETAGAPRA